MPDNEFAARIEGNRIIARGYQRQLAEARAASRSARAALAEIARVLLQRHQEGWEKRLLDIARAAMGEGK